jgi:hypothetical protein
MEIVVRWDRIKEKTLMWIAWHLPRDVVKWCAIRVFAHATTGQWGREQTPALLATDSLRRWDIPHERQSPKDAILHSL